MTSPTLTHTQWGESPDPMTSYPEGVTPVLCVLINVLSKVSCVVYSFYYDILYLFTARNGSNFPRNDVSYHNLEVRNFNEVEQLGKYVRGSKVACDLQMWYIQGSV